MVPASGPSSRAWGPTCLTRLGDWDPGHAAACVEGEAAASAAPQQLGVDTLAGRVYKEQVAMGWPGLAKESKEICQKLGIEDCNTANLTTIMDG